MASPSSFATARQLFLKDVVRNLYANNSWMKESRDHSKHAVGKTVNIPNRGRPKGVINNSSVPLTATGHGDTLQSYNMDEHQSIPTKITWSEEILVSYAMREEILMDHTSVFENNAAEKTLFKWASDDTLLTTGDAKAVSVGGGATGTRKKLTASDIVRLSTKLTKQNVPNDGKRCLLVSADMHADLIDIDKFVSQDFVNNGQPIVSGRVGQIHGFKVFVRSRTIIKEIAIGAAEGDHAPKVWLEDNSATERVLGATATDTAIAWHPNYVSSAVSPDTLVSLIDAHGGVEVSVTGIAGGSKMSTTGIGVVTLAEAVVS